MTRLEERRARREYVVGTAGHGSWFDAAAKALPQPFDDLSRDFGTDVYGEMMKDPQVSAAVTVLKAAILEDGVILSPAVENQQDPNYKQSVEIRDIADRMFKHLETPFDAVLWNLLDGMVYGNKVAELVSEWQDVDGDQLLQLKAIKPKPGQSVAYVVDQYMNLIGLLGAAPGQQMVGQQVLLDASSITIHKPDKFAIYTHRPVDCDPRGTSILRPAYEPWWKKRQISPEYLRYLSQFASPSIWATPPEGADLVPSTDSLGNPTDDAGDVVDDPDGDGADEIAAPMSQQDELLAVVLAWRDGYAMVAPHGTEIHAVEMQGDGAAFREAFSLYDSQIVMAILTQSLATQEGEHQARSAASVHQDVLDTLVRQGKKALVEVIFQQILRPWVKRNWGDEAADTLVPVPSLGTTERPDLPAVMTAVAALMRSAYFHSSQLPALDDMLALPTRDMTQPNTLQPPASPAPGEPSAPAGGEMGRGGSDTDEPNPGAPSGPAERGGRGAQPSRRPTRRSNP